VAIKRSAKSRTELIRLATPTAGRALIMPSLPNSLLLSPFGFLPYWFSGFLVAWYSGLPIRPRPRQTMKGKGAAGNQGWHFRCTDNGDKGMRSAPRAFDFTFVPHNDHKTGSSKANCFLDLRRALKRNK